MADAHRTGAPRRALLGLDVGTTNVGLAVTDESALKLIRTIVSNVLEHPTELEKYGRINLGEALTQLAT